MKNPFGRLENVCNTWCFMYGDIMILPSFIAFILLGLIWGACFIVAFVIFAMIYATASIFLVARRAISASYIAVNNTIDLWLDYASGNKSDG